MDEKTFILKKEEYKGLLESEKEINESLNSNIDFNDKYKNYGILDHSWYQKYKKYLFDLMSGKTNAIFEDYDFDSLNTKTEEKIYCLKNEEYPFNFITNFEGVSKNFINLLKKNFSSKTQKKFDIILNFAIFGGQCLIIEDKNDENDNYITFYEQNKINNIDFWLEITNKKERKKHINFILKYNL